jgi:uncharacterized protein YkwD
MTSSHGTKRLIVGFILAILLFGSLPVYFYLSAKNLPIQKPIVNEGTGILSGIIPEPISILSTVTVSEKAINIPVTGCSPAQNKDLEKQVFKLINQERAKNGVPDLASQNQLAAAALAHSTDMACRGFFSHINLDGKTAYDRIKAQGYHYSYAGEIIYAGDGTLNTPGQAINTWLGSAAHKQAMLNPAYSEVGVGIIYLPGSKFGGYYTVVFADPEN